MKHENGQSYDDSNSVQKEQMNSENDNSRHYNLEPNFNQEGDQSVDYSHSEQDNVPNDVPQAEQPITETPAPPPPATPILTSAPVTVHECYTGTKGEGCLEQAAPSLTSCGTSTDDYCYKLDRIKTSDNKVCARYSCVDGYTAVGYGENNAKNVTLNGNDAGSTFQSTGMMYRCKGHGCNASSKISTKLIAIFIPFIFFLI
uniref:Uncharacterized protein n=1 Tax=Panagrolaimus sp. JU765 TaxID=591449 RepID=A0AC34RK74_9BILA